MATILIAEDHVDDRRFLATLVGYFGHKVIEASDGAEALDLVRNRRPDVVISEVLMPTLDGYELVREMRAIPDVADTPVLFCTPTYHEREVLALAERYGARGIITKPCDPAIVLKKIDAVLAVDSVSPDATSLLHEEARLDRETVFEKVRILFDSELRLSALVDVGRSVSSERDPLALLQRMCWSAREVTLASYAAIDVLSDDRTHLRRVSSTDAAPRARTGRAAAELYGVPLKELIEQRTPTRTVSPPCLGVPIASPTRVYGWLTLTNKLGADEFSAIDEQMAMALGERAGVAYENARSYEDARQHVAALEQEVAEHKGMADELRRSKDRTEFALAAAHMGIGETDLDTGSEFWSESRAALFGISSKTFAGTLEAFYELVHPEDRDAMRQEFESAVAGGGHDFVAEFRTIWPDGTTHWIHNRARISRDPAGRPASVLGVALDITERKLLESQFHQAQKMEAIGMLAGGVAHDFNTLLTVIHGYAQFLGDEPLSDGQRSDVAEIIGASDRAAVLTRQLLALSQKQVLQPTLVDVNALVNSVARMLKRVIGRRVELTTTLEPDLQLVRADAGQIEQVLINLIVNARDAMAEGGRVTIETANARLEAGDTIRRAMAKPGPYVTVVVSDTGAGMDAKTQERLFEPFFTTKERGKGTGLGLATVDGIITQSGGYIDVKTDRSRGSSFTVYLPVVKREANAGTAPAAPRARVAGRASSVLIVEDDQPLRNLTRVILERVGYRVVDAPTGDAAEAMCDRDGVTFDLLVTDVLMPGGTGPALFKRLARTRPALRVLYVSGYAGDALDPGSVETHGSFLLKPFTADGLVRSVKEVLAR